MTFSQEKTVYDIDVNYLYGRIAEHNKDISHLIAGHPESVLISYNKRTFGAHGWERRYNYPDWGFSFLYQNTHSPELGNNYGLYGHYNFYFLKRRLQLRLAQGIAYNTNPFDINDNFRNVAYGSHLVGTSMLMLNYKSKPFLGGFGFRTGISLVHYSNAAVKAPNTSINVVNFNVGLSYAFNAEDLPEYQPLVREKYTEPIAFNLEIRGGINEGERIGFGTYPFFEFSAYADKVLSHKSRIVLGSELFLSYFLKEEIEYIGTIRPNSGAAGTDFKRAAVFAGHELKFGRYSFVTHVGYYVYYPYKYESRVYFRIGLKRTFGEHFFGTVAVRTHGANAEAMAFGIGYRL